MQRSRQLLVGGALAVALLSGIVAFRHVGSERARITLDDTLSKLPPGYAATHGEVSYDGVTGVLTVHDLVVTRLGAPLFSASRVLAAGWKSFALRDVFDPEAYPGGKPAWTDRRPLIRHLEARDVVIPTPDLTLQPLRARMLQIDGLSGRPFAAPPSIANFGKSAFLADAGLALSASELSAQDIAIVSRDDADQAKFTEITISGYDQGTLAKLDLTKADVEAVRPAYPGRHVSVTLGHLALDSLDVRHALTLVQQGAGDRPARLAGLHLAAADLSAFKVDVPGGPLVSLASMHVTYFDRTGAMHSGEATIRTLSADLHETPRTGDTAAVVQAFGTDHITLDVDFAGRKDERTHTLDIDRYDYTLHDLGVLRISAAFADIPSGDVPPDATQAGRVAALGQAKIVSGKISWEDHGLANRLIAVAAMKSGSTPDAIKGQLAMPLMALGMMLPDQPDAADQVSRFLNDPKLLTITLHPAQPRSVSDLAAASMQAKAKMLGVHIDGS